MTLAPCRLLPGRRSPSLDQVLGALDEAGDRGATSAQVARLVGLPVDRVRRVLNSHPELVELRWSAADRAARWFRLEGTRG